MTREILDPAGTLCQVTFPDPIPGVIPFGSLTVVAGASGAGKTILMAECMQRMRDGRTFCGHPTNPSVEYYVIAADRDWSTYAQAYGAAGFPTIKRYVLAEDPDFDPRSWGRKQSAFTLFEDCLKRLDPQPGSIVFVDPTAPLFIQGNQNDARDVALSLHWFRRLARQYQITLVLFANVGKQKAEDVYRRAQDRIAGSGAFVAYSDTQISVDQDVDGVVTVQLTPRNGAPEEHQFKFNIETKLFAPYQDVPQPTADMPKHLQATYLMVPTEGGGQNGDGSITSPDLVRRLCEGGSVKRAMAFRHIQQLLEKGYLNRSELGVLTRTNKGLPAASTTPAKTPARERE